MANISGKETKPEVLVRKFLFSKGYRFRKNQKSLPGSPDIVLPKYKTVIFIHGCFWHGHKNCKAAKLPTTRVKFWKNKIEGNVARDKIKSKELKKIDYNVLTIWQCQITNKTKRQKTFNKLEKALTSALRPAQVIVVKSPQRS